MVTCWRSRKLEAAHGFGYAAVRGLPMIMMMMMMMRMMMTIDVVSRLPLPVDCMRVSVVTVTEIVENNQGPKM